MKSSLGNRDTGCACIKFCDFKYILKTNAWILLRLTRCFMAVWFTVQEHVSFKATRPIMIFTMNLLLRLFRPILKTCHPNMWSAMREKRSFPILFVCRLTRLTNLLNKSRLNLADLNVDKLSLCIEYMFWHQRFTIIKITLELDKNWLAKWNISKKCQKYFI